jgi:hypothetical protein
MVAFERDEDDALTLLEGGEERFGFDVWQDLWWMFEFLYASHVQPARARPALEAHAPRMPGRERVAFIGSYVGLNSIAEGLVVLGELQTAAALYPVYQDALSLGLVADYFGVTESGAGLAAAAGGNWEAAERHHVKALQLANDIPHVAAQADTRLWYARMRLARKAPGDFERARGLLMEAVPMLERWGRARRLRECRELLAVSVDR